MRRTLWIPALTTMLLLMVAGPASAQPSGSSNPHAPAALPELDDVGNEAERRRASKRKDRRSDRKETRRDRRRDRKEARSDRREVRRDRREVRRDRRVVYETRRRAARAAHRDQQRRRVWREVRVHRPRPPRVVVRSPRRPVVVVHDHDHSASRPAPRREKHGGLTAGWRHVGGGFGAAWVPEFEASTPMGRFELGAGGYTKGLYGGGGLEIAGSSDVPIAATGVGFVGVAVPLPVVHPLFGIKVGGGGHLDRESFAPHIAVGPQAGVIVRPYDGRFGLRVMLDVEAVVRPTKGEIAPQAMLTFAGVF